MTTPTPILLGKANTQFDMTELTIRCKTRLGRVPKFGFGVAGGENFVNLGGEKLSRDELYSLGFIHAAAGPLR